MGQQAFDASELRNQFLRCLFSYAGTSWNVVSRVAHQPEHVDDLCGRFDIEFLLNFIDSHDVEVLVAVFRAIHEYMFAYKLAIVFVGSHHIRIDAPFPGLCRQCADHIVCLIASYFQYGNPVGFDNILYRRYRPFDYLRRFFSLRFVCGKGIVSECRPGRVECDSDVCGFFFPQHFLQCIDKA